MRRLLCALLCLGLCGTALAAPAARYSPVRMLPIVTSPLLFTGGQVQPGSQLTSVLTPAPSLGLTPSLLTPAVRLTPLVSPAILPAATVLTPALLPVSQLTQDITQQQAAAGGDILAASPQLGTFFDGSLHAVAPSGVVDSYTGLSPPSGSPKPLRSLDSIKELRFGTYNVENLFQSVGKYEPDLSKAGKRDKVAPEQAKPEWQLKGVAKAILESDLDLVSVAEVENIKALQDFSDQYLGGQYRALLIEGNDERGIDIGFLVKKDIPFELEHRTNKDEMWVDPEGDGQAQKLFSRDLPALIVRAPGRAQPLFVYLGTHYKSKRPRSHNDPTSEKMRRAQVERTAEIIARLRKEFGAAVPIMLGGDYNGAVNEESTFDALKEGGAGLTDALDLVQPPLGKLDRVTHTYHPKGGAAHKSQMDAIFLSETMKGLVTAAKVYRYKDASGKEKPLPETWEERSKNPSDHFPLLVTLKFQPLLHP